MKSMRNSQHIQTHEIYSGLLWKVASLSPRWTECTRILLWFGIDKGNWLRSPISLNMLNCFKDYKRYIHMSYRILDFVKLMKTKFTMEQPCMLPILYCQYHSYWCPGSLHRQVISSHNINCEGLLAFLEGKLSITCIISLTRNDMK